MWTALSCAEHRTAYFTKLDWPQSTKKHEKATAALSCPGADHGLLVRQEKLGAVIPDERTRPVPQEEWIEAKGEVGAKGREENRSREAQARCKMSRWMSRCASIGRPNWP
jgi:hypothetical protein